MSISPVVDEDPLTADAPPSYADAVEYLRRSKDGALRISPASARTTDRDGASQSTATPTAASTSERQPLLSSSPTTLEQHSPLSEHHVNSSSSRGYFAPLVQLKYWKALFHLLVLNFPFALAAWIVLFVGVLVGTSLLITLPLGTIVWWITLIMSRSFTNAELSMQARFHGVRSPDRHRPIFRRLSSQVDPETLRPTKQSFIQNSSAMFQDWEGSYLPIFYFLIVKSVISLVLFPLIIVLAAPAIVLVIPLPAVLRLVRGIGRWQAKIAVKGLA